MKMNKIRFAVLLGALFTLFACSDIESNDAIQTQNSGTYLSVQQDGISVDARSVDPDITAALEKMQYVTLYGTRTKDGDGNTVSGKRTNLAGGSQYYTITSLYNALILLPDGAGEYAFEFVGQIDSVYFYEKKTDITIEENKTNTISFENLAAVKGASDYTDLGDYGGVDIKLYIANKSSVSINKSIITVTNLDTGEEVEKKESTHYSNPAPLEYKRWTSYSSDSSSDKRIDTGTYRITFEFYGSGLLLNTLQYVVHVAKGLNTIYEDNIDLNEVYTITYQPNSGSLAEGETQVTKYSRKSEFALPNMTRDKYTFLGWYDNSSFEGNPVTKIEKGMTGNKTFYARFVSSALYVNATNGKDTNDGSSYTSSKALLTLSKALELMSLTVDGKKLDYTIYLSGTFTGAQTIADSSNSALPAASITLVGYNGVDSTTGEPKDVLNGGFSESSKGSTLSISTTVPVTIKNLKITGGYAEEGKGGGITLSQGTSLTMESGEISGNSGVSSSAAVYVSASSTKGAVFTMNGGTICNNTGNGVCVHDGTKPASFNMTGGTITGNSGYGVWLPASGGYFAPFSMSGSAVVTADNIVEVPNRIIFAGALTGDAPVVTIKPTRYSEDNKVVYLADDITDTTLLASAVEKIAVVPQTVEGEEVVWGIDSEGNLKKLVAVAQVGGAKCYSVADVIDKIKSASTATTVVLYKTLTASDIGKAGTSDTIINAIKSNSNTSATFAVSVGSTDGKIALDADCSSMFSGCSKITSLDMSGFDTSAVTDMSYMFSSCKELTEINMSGFETGSVTNIRDMFSECEKLTALDVSNFDTSKVKKFSSMFEACKALTELDVSSFSVSSAEEAHYMFRNCSNLKTIKAASGANWSSSISESVSAYMFEGCTKLSGAITYGSDKLTSAYANTTTGYFTVKN